MHGSLGVIFANDTKEGPLKEIRKLLNRNGCLKTNPFFLQGICREELFVFFEEFKGDVDAAIKAFENLTGASRDLCNSKDPQSMAKTFAKAATQAEMLLSTAFSNQLSHIVSLLSSAEEKISLGKKPQAKSTLAAMIHFQKILEAIPLTYGQIPLHAQGRLMFKPSESF